MTDPTSWTELFNPGPDSPVVEDLADGSAWLLEFVATVEFLRRGDRLDLTVWDALEEAIRWWTDERVGSIEGVPGVDAVGEAQAGSDCLHRAMADLIVAIQFEPPIKMDIALQQAVRRWAESTDVEKQQRPTVAPH